MTLTIDRLVTHAKIPRKSKFDHSLVEQVARKEFAAETARQLRRPWSVQVQVARIRRLRVRVTIPAAQLTPDALAAAWAAAFIRELFKALAQPNGSEIVRFESRAEYLAAAIRDRFAGLASRRWAYEELEASSAVDAGAAAFFEQQPSQIIPTLLILENWNLLDRLLAVWDAATFDRILFVIESGNGIKEENLSVEDLITVAGLLLGRPSTFASGDSPRNTNVRGRNLALKLFLCLARESDWRSTSPLSPRRIFRALLVLEALLDFQASVWAVRPPLPSSSQPFDDRTAHSTDSIISASINDSSGGQTAVIELLNKLSSIASSGTRQNELKSIANSGAGQNLLAEFWNIIETAPGTSRTGLAEVLTKLTSAARSDSHRQQVAAFWNIVVSGSSENRIALAALSADLTPVQSHGSESKWISTDFAGLFLLVRVLDKLGWEDQLARSSLGATYGPRLLTYTLAGVATAILGRFNEEPTYLDTGIALFSGWTGVPDLHGFRAFLAAGSVETRQDLLAGMLTEATAIEYSASWQTCFDALANYLIREFTEQIRCFGKPTRSFVVKNFVALPGHVLIEENRLVVMFTSSPLHVVIHLSRLDDPLEAVSWLGRRRIEFQADGF